MLHKHIGNAFHSLLQFSISFKPHCDIFITEVDWPTLSKIVETLYNTIKKASTPMTAGITFHSISNSIPSFHHTVFNPFPNHQFSICCNFFFRLYRALYFHNFQHIKLMDAVTTAGDELGCNVVNFLVNFGFFWHNNQQLLNESCKRVDETVEALWF